MSQLATRPTEADRYVHSRSSLKHDLSLLKMGIDPDAPHQKGERVGSLENGISDSYDSLSISTLWIDFTSMLVKKSQTEPIWPFIFCTEQ